MWVGIALAVVGVVAAAVVLVLAVWKGVVRGHLRKLMGKREEGRILRRAFDELVGGLQEGPIEELERVVGDIEAVERHSLSDLHENARILAEEVNVMALPARLIPVSEALADAVDVLAEEADKAGEGSIGDDNLEALRSIDRARVDRAFAYVDARVSALAEEYGVNEQEVRGRGL